MFRALIGLIVGGVWFPAVLLVMGGGPFAFLFGLFTVTASVIAFPIVLLLRWWRWMNLPACALFGAVLGLLGGYASSAAFGTPPPPIAQSGGLIGLGVASSILFWLVGVWRNPWFAKTRPMVNVPAT